MIIQDYHPNDTSKWEYVATPLSLRFGYKRFSHCVGYDLIILMERAENSKEISLTLKNEYLKDEAFESFKENMKGGKGVKAFFPSEIKDDCSTILFWVQNSENIFSFTDKLFSELTALMRASVAGFEVGSIVKSTVNTQFHLTRHIPLHKKFTDYIIENYDGKQQGRQ